MGVNRVAEYDTPLAAPLPVTPAQAGIQDSPQRGAGESLTNHDQRTFTVTTSWHLAWVPACAGTTRGWASIGWRNTTHHSRHPTPSFPRRRESRTYHSVGRENHSPTTINALSPSPRCGALPGSPPARGRRGGGRQSGGAIRHTTRGTPPRHSRAGGNPGFTTAWGGGVTQPTTINALSPSPRCGTLPGSPPARGRRGGGRQSGGEIRHTTRGTPPRHSRTGGNPGFTTAWGEGITQPTTINALSPSPRRGTLPGSPPARGRRQGM